MAQRGASRGTGNDSVAVRLFRATRIGRRDAGKLGLGVDMGLRRGIALTERMLHAVNPKRAGRVRARMRGLPKPPSSIPVLIQALWATADAWASAAYETRWKDKAAGINTRPTCRGAGCWGCCRGEVATAPGEAVAIAQHLTEEQVLAVMGHQPAVPTEALCPLLTKDKLCGIYAIRPAVCRTYMVVTPVDDCYPERTGKGRRVASPANEAFVEFMEDVAKNPDHRSLIVCLQDALRKTGRA